MTWPATSWDPAEICDAPEAARRLNLSEADVIKAIRAKRLPGILVGPGKWRLHWPTIEARLRGESEQDPDEFVDIDTAAAKLGVTRATLTRAIRDKQIPSGQLGNLTRLHWPSVVARFATIDGSTA